MYTEVCNQFEDINDVKGRRRTDADEIMEEKKEIESRRRLDDKFKKWCHASEEMASKFGA
jgi:nucleosome binding factor SPN SPT16 subunit